MNSSQSAKKEKIDGIFSVTSDQIPHGDVKMTFGMYKDYFTCQEALEKHKDQLIIANGSYRRVSTEIVGGNSCCSRILINYHAARLGFLWFRHTNRRLIIRTSEWIRALQAGILSLAAVAVSRSECKRAPRDLQDRVQEPVRRTMQTRDNYDKVFVTM